MIRHATDLNAEAWKGGDLAAADPAGLLVDPTPLFGGEPGSEASGPGTGHVRPFAVAEEPTGLYFGSSGSPSAAGASAADGAETIVDAPVGRPTLPVALTAEISFAAAEPPLAALPPSGASDPSAHAPQDLDFLLSRGGPGQDTPFLDPDDVLPFTFDEVDVLLPDPETAGATKSGSDGGTASSPPASGGSGLHINLIPEASVANAPSWFTPSVQNAAHMLEQAFSDNITLNITYGWGTIGGSAISNQNVALGGAFLQSFSYSTVRSWLAADASSADDSSAVTWLPNATSVNGRSTFRVSTAQEKALGHFTGDPNAVDGQMGFGTGWTSGAIVGAALHELTHAMGRLSGSSMDLFRFSAEGTYQFTLGQPAYFSVDNGHTRLANFGQTSDTGDWLSSGGTLTPNDPLNEFINSSSNALTAVDLTVMDVLGFDRAGTAPPPDDYANTLADTTHPFGQVAVGGTSTGNLEAIGDRDWFSVQLAAGTTYVINLEGAPTGAGTLSDAYLRFHDGTGALVAQNDDVSSSNLNSQVTFAATASGTYYVEAGAFSDTGTGTYRVSISGTATNHAPTITSDGGGDTATLAVAENMTAITVITSTDADAGTTLNYAIVGGADLAKFQINAATGALSFLAAPDFENPADADHNNSYVVQVRASDGSLFDTQTITVNITNANETPTITSDGGGDTAMRAIAENTIAVTVIAASDPDAGTTLNYAIVGGADPAKFQINAATGALAFLAAPDFENPSDADHNNSYVVQVRASDGSLFDTQTITVNVTDVAESTIVGDNFPNTLTGTADSDVIQGLGGNDVLRGLGANDRLDGGPGDDVIDGGPGSDTAVFSQNLSAYALRDLGDRVTVSGPDGNDTVIATEHLQFADGTIHYDDGDALFDTVFYDRSYLDVFHSGIDARTHYDTWGRHESRDPNPLFSTVGYLAANKDVAASGVNPLAQYAQLGWKEGRDPSAAFDDELYLKNNPDVAAAGMNPLAHYLQFGIHEGRQTYAAIGPTIAGGFDAEYYLLANPDVAASGMDPLVHFNTFGWHEGRNPNAVFDTAGYLAHYADVAAAGMNPLQHYDQFGWKEGRDPSAAFDTQAYLAHYADVAAAHIDPLEHYLHWGALEGRLAFGDGLWA